MGIKIVVPTYQPHSESLKYVSRPFSLEAKVVALLGNGKPNSPVFLGFLGELLTQKYNVKQIVAFNKDTTTKLAPRELLQGIARTCDVAVTGVGD